MAGCIREVVAGCQRVEFPRQSAQGFFIREGRLYPGNQGIVVGAAVEELAKSFILSAVGSYI